MDEREKLKMLLEDLRLQVVAIDSQPLIPGSVKLAVNTTFQIMEILIATEAGRG